MQKILLCIRSNWSIARHAAGRFLAIVCMLVGLTGGIASLAPLFSTSLPFQQVTQSIALAAIAVASLAVLAWREISLGRKAAVAGTLDRQHAASEKVRDLYIDLWKKSNEYLSVEQAEEALTYARKNIQSVLDDYAVIFSQMSALRCRVCVKMITSDEAADYVVTLSRDHLSSAECRAHDSVRESKKIDKLNDNNSLIKLFDPKHPDQGYFFANNLPKVKEYRSTSIKYHQTIARNSNEAIETKWPLPYKSTIVVPIWRESLDASDLAVAKHLVVGFLGVDSPSRGAFRRRWDVALAKSLANSLFPILHLYSDIGSRVQAGGVTDGSQKAAS